MATIPFDVLVLVPVECEHPAPTPVALDRSSVDRVFEVIGPKVRVPVPLNLYPQGELFLEVLSLKHLRPEVLVGRSAALTALGEVQGRLRDARLRGQSLDNLIAEVRSRWPSLRTQSEDRQPEPRVDRRVADLLEQIALPYEPREISAEHHSLEAEIQALQAALLGHVFGDPGFRRFEATARGIELLCRGGELAEGRQVLLAGFRADELPEALTTFEERFSAAPPALVLIDQAFDATPRSLDLLERVLAFAARMLAPTVIWAGPELFRIPDLREVDALPYLRHHFEGAAYARWNRLRTSESARWVLCGLNRLLARPPFGPLNPPRGIPFVERESLWLSPVFVLGALMAMSQARRGWPGRFTDHRSIAIENLPLWGDPPLAAELALWEERLAQLQEVGLTPLVAPRGRDTAAAPFEASLSSDSFRTTLLVAQLSAFFLWAERRQRELLQSGDIATDLRRELVRWFESTDLGIPKDLTLEVEPTEAPDARALRLRFTPSGGLQPLELRFRFELDRTEA